MRKLSNATGYQSINSESVLSYWLLMNGDDIQSGILTPFKIKKKLRTQTHIATILNDDKIMPESNAK